MCFTTGAVHWYMCSVISPATTWCVHPQGTLLMVLPLSLPLLWESQLSAQVSLRCCAHRAASLDAQKPFNRTCCGSARNQLRFQPCFLMYAPAQPAAAGTGPTSPTGLPIISLDILQVLCSQSRWCKSTKVMHLYPLWEHQV